MRLGRYIILLLSFYYCLELKSQDCTYSKYYELVGSAKKSSKKGDFKEARTLYQEAFAEKAFPLGQDVSLALYTAVKLKDHQWANSLATTLAKGGIPMRYFTKYKDEKWYNSFVENFQEYQTSFQLNFNQKFQTELSMLLQRDIDINEKYHKWRTGEIEVELSELIDDANSVLSQFETLISSYGFPNERKLGYNYVKRKNTVEPYQTTVLMIHIYQRGVPLLKGALSSIICEGGLPPEYRQILENLKGFGDGIGVEQEMRARYLKFKGSE